MDKEKLTVFWFRRDLRLEDNTGLAHARCSDYPVLPLFIFDDNILQELPENDARVTFLYDTLRNLNASLRRHDSSLLCLKGEPLEVWKQLVESYEIEALYYNRDYEPYARSRDKEVTDFLHRKGISVHSYKDQVLFEEDEIVQSNGKPYTVFTPYRNKWLQAMDQVMGKTGDKVGSMNFFQADHLFPGLESLGFRSSSLRVEPWDLSIVTDYALKRDYPEFETSHLGPHLRFGTVSIRSIVKKLSRENGSFLSELIWREFFMQILYHFPEVVTENFKPKYNGISWRNNEKEFERWCRGETGYPLVDAGMRQLNETGFMHNRVRMVAAGFLCKHLLTDWRWGEAYFAEKLLDYELASNNGNWQWAAGTGCDAAPYFRIFNPAEQQRKFDRDLNYVKHWIPEYGTAGYPEPVVEHRFARERALRAYREELL